jgi:hypothetical protein
LADVLAFIDRAERRYGESDQETMPEPLFSGDTGANGQDMEDLSSLGETTVAAHVSDVCFLARHELRQAHQQLESAHAEHEARIVACERMLRKSHRALLALAQAVALATDRMPVIHDVQRAEAASAVAVRALFTRLRGELGRYGSGDHQPSSIVAALRRSANALAVVLGSADFQEARLSDALLLRSLRSRVLEWGRAPEPRAGQQLLSDLKSSADLLRTINHRQELRAHDDELIRMLHRQLEHDGRPQPRLAELVGRARALRGLDDELDGIIDAVLAGADDERMRSDFAQAVTRLHEERQDRGRAGG